MKRNELDKIVRRNAFRRRSVLRVIRRAATIAIISLLILAFLAVTIWLMEK